MEGLIFPDDGGNPPQCYLCVWTPWELCWDWMGVPWTNTPWSWSKAKRRYFWLSGWIDTWKFVSSRLTLNAMFPFFTVLRTEEILDMLKWGAPMCAFSGFISITGLHPLRTRNTLEKNPWVSGGTPIISFFQSMPWAWSWPQVIWSPRQGQT